LLKNLYFSSHLIKQLQHINVIQSSDKTISIGFVYLMRFIVFLRIAYLLHLMAIGGFLLFYYAGQYALQIYPEGNWSQFYLFAFISLYGLSLPFFAEFDARSRYQNYKLVKDKLHEYGYEKRLLKPFVFSRCQRDAVQVAAKQLDYEKECLSFFYESGFRWFHIFPRILIVHPKTILTKKYWKQTLFVAHYKSKYFLW